MKSKERDQIDSLERDTRHRIADHIKLARVKMEYSLNDLASKSGVSVSTIHKIENYAMVPTVVTLLKIAKGLQKDLHFFIDNEDSQKNYKVTRKNEGTFSMVKSEKTLIRAVSSKLAADTHLEVHHVRIGRGGSSGKEPTIHDSEEVAICLKGRIEFVVEKERIGLEPFDSIQIRGGVHHWWRNVWSGETEMLFIFSPLFFS